MSWAGMLRLTESVEYSRCDNQLDVVRTRICAKKFKKKEILKQ